MHSRTAHQAALWTWQALEYLVGEKLLHFVEAAEHHPLFAHELPSFDAEIKKVFSVNEVTNYAVRLERTKRLSVSQRAAIRAISSVRTNPLGWSRLG